MAIYVGRWDCTTCGTMGNHGPETRCPNCGTPRPEDVSFYLSSDARVVRDKRKIKEAKAGVDWRCGHCSSHNKAAITACQTCGNPRDQLSEDVGLDIKEYAPGQAPDSAPAGPTALEDYEKSVQRHEAGRFRKLRPIVYITIAAAIMAVLSGFFPTSVDAEVVRFSWKRSIQIEHHEPVAHEDWSTPSGAFEIESFRAVHHYDKEFSHTETRYRDVREQIGTESYVCGKTDMGNGYFQDRYCTRPVYTTRSEPYRYDVYRDVPVYRTKYAYKIMQWVAQPAYIIRDEGTDHAARWPLAPSSFQGNDWRNGKQTGHYFITVKAGKEHKEAVGHRYWEGLRLGNEVPASRAWLYGAWYGLSDPAHRE